MAQQRAHYLHGTWVGFLLTGECLEGGDLDMRVLVALGRVAEDRLSSATSPLALSTPIPHARHEPGPYH